MSSDFSLVRLILVMACRDGSATVMQRRRRASVLDPH